MESNEKELLKFLHRSFSGLFLVNEPLASHTTYRIGGPADHFVYPQTTEQLLTLLQTCTDLDVNHIFIGGGANLLVHDKGYRGVVVNLSKYFNSITRNGDTVKVQAGVLLKDLVIFCEREGLGGLQYLSGIPGTVGGALMMNAGTHKTEIGEHVKDVQFLDGNLNKVNLQNRYIDFNYRSTPQLQETTILSCTLQLQKASVAELHNARVAQLQTRAAKQPLEFPSCGSVFKRPPENYVGAMIEELGLKGTSHGDAMISPKHGGFIVNLGCAQASDVLFLIEDIKEKVARKFDIVLKEEVKRVGF